MRSFSRFLRGWKARLGIAAVLLFFVIPALIYLGVMWHGERELRQAIAETDAADPRWR